MQIRTAQASDSDSIACLVNHAFRSESFFTNGDRTSPEKVRALLHTGKFLLLFDAEELAGCVYVEMREDRGYFGLLAVDPMRQRSGIGARLIAAAEQECRSAGCRFMDLTIVNLRTELPPYYQRFGYTETAFLPFPADQNPKLPVHLVQMSKKL
jgi:N-acetylglutamate synthase-like GNAT family acetyltransferase